MLNMLLVKHSVTKGRLISFCYDDDDDRRLSVVKPLDVLLLQFGILSHSTSDIHLLLVPLNVI